MTHKTADKWLGALLLAGCSGRADFGGVTLLCSLSDLLILRIRELRESERQMASAYPRWAETCFSPRLQTLIRERSACAGHRADALGLILPGLGENTMTGCRVASILEEGGRYLDVEPETDPGVLDAALGSAVYALCHCMICSYHCARNSASLLNLREAFALQKFLLEEQRLESAIKRLVEETLSPEALQTPGFAAHQLNQMRKAP